MEQYDWLWNGLYTGQGLLYCQSFSGGELQARGWKHDTNAIMATLFVSGILQRPSFLDNLKWLDKKLDLQQTSTWDMFVLGVFFLFISILSAIPTVASNNLVLGKNSWPTSALLHRRPNQALI